MSSVRYGPISGQHNDWKRIGERLSSCKSSSLGSEKQEDGLVEGKVLIVCGKSDPVIIHNELVEDATEVLGAENVQFAMWDTNYQSRRLQRSSNWYGTSGVRSNSDGGMMYATGLLYSTVKV